MQVHRYDNRGYPNSQSYNNNGNSHRRYSNDRPLQQTQQQQQEYNDHPRRRRYSYDSNHDYSRREEGEGRYYPSSRDESYHIGGGGDSHRWRFERSRSHSRDRSRSRDRYRDSNRGRDFDRTRDPDRDYSHHHPRHRWPPVFDQDNGASYYTFDANSGYFYDALTNFYYEPRTKLYYSNVEQKYYTYNTVSRRFLPYDEGTATADTNITTSTVDQNMVNATTAPTGASNSEQKGANKKVITIGEIKKLKSVGNLPAPPISEHISTSTNKQKLKGMKPKQKLVDRDTAANIQKWNASVTNGSNEIQKDVTSVSTSANRSNINGGGELDQHVYFYKDSPVCVLCKRKFESLSKLRAHESQSALHQYHLSHNNNNNNDTGVIKQYQDRAQHRRALYHDSTSTVQQLQTQAEELALHQAPNLHHPSYEPGTTTDNTSGTTVNTMQVGQKLLQKLGWKAEDDNNDADNKTNNSRSRGSEEMRKRLQQDWRTIEALAASNGAGNSGKNNRHRR